MGTIYKHMLMGNNKKGDLGHVWMAAHFPHRIRKEYVQQTNISSSVDKILVDQLPVVTYRILGFLLLGITRLYSKKVEYLLIDCNHSLYEMKVYTEGRKKVNINLGGMCIPESSSSQRSKSNGVDTNLAECSRRRKSNTFMNAMRAEFSSISLPENFELDAFDLEVVEDDSSNEHHVKSHLEIVLPDKWENDQTGHNSETSPENLRGRFSLEDCIVPMELDEPDEEVTLPKIPSIQQQDPESNNNNNTNSLDDLMIFEDRNDNNNHQHEELTPLETTKFADDNIMLKPTPEKLSVTVSVTPPSGSGKDKSDTMTVRTPAVKERVTRVSRKRKFVYDDTTVVRNVVYKEWVTNASDLLRERIRAPSTSSFDYLMKPIIPINAGFPSDLRSIDVVQMEQVEQTFEPCAVNVMDKSPENENENEEELIAPLTPITTQSASKVNQEEPTSSCESREKDMFLFPNNDEELDSVPVFSKQGPSSSTLQNQGPENWSALTKSVGGYLHSKKDEVVKLSEILKQKTKRESARFFSEILVLKSGGYIDVKQKKAYDEIFVTQTFKLKEVFEA